MEEIFDTADKALFVSTLLRWYDVSKRSLPWRDRQHDAYAVWISEIMLQQTTVAAVIPYYERWMAALPTVESVAAADIQDILLLWAGLGYYSRARNICKAAEVILLEYGGRLPDTVKDLVKLPGIGRYTAGAIASIAYGKREAVLDGNVMRVYSRLAAFDGDIDKPSEISKLWAIAETNVPAERSGDYNQALMELGATVCLPGRPKCAGCPVRAYCKAFAIGVPGLYPVRTKATRWIDVDDCAVLVELDGRLLVVKRPDTGVWAGLWEVPRATLQEGETHADCARRAINSIGEGDVGAVVGRVKHTVMNRRITLTAYSGELSADESVNGGSHSEIRWATDEELEGLPFASPQQKLIQTWQTAKNQRYLAL